MPFSAITTGGSDGSAERGAAVRRVPGWRCEAVGIPVYENNVHAAREGWPAILARGPRRPMGVLAADGRVRRVRAAAAKSAYHGVDDLPGTLQQVTDDAPVILMAHEPDIFPTVPERVSLTICGPYARWPGSHFRLRAGSCRRAIGSALRLWPQDRRRPPHDRFRWSWLLVVADPVRLAARNRRRRSRRRRRSVTATTVAGSRGPHHSRRRAVSATCFRFASISKTPTPAASSITPRSCASPSAAAPIFCDLLGTDARRLIDGSDSREPAAFVVRRMNFDFFRPGRMDDLLEVETRVKELGGASVTLIQTITRGGPTSRRGRGDGRPRFDFRQAAALERRRPRGFPGATQAKIPGQTVNADALRLASKRVHSAG